MKQNNTPYQFFLQFLFRTPTFPFTYGETLLQTGDIHSLLRNAIFREALFLASPVLYAEIEKYTHNTLSGKDAQRFENAIWRYFKRMCTRCTPFGLFAAFSMGTWGHNTQITLPDTYTNRRVTRLDMYLICTLTQHLLEQCQNQLHFYPNNSIYKAGDRLRYVEYQLKEKKYRTYHISEVDASEYLETILEKARDGCLLRDLAGSIVDDDISLDDALEFLNDLVESQLLLSELEPRVTGSDTLDTLIRQLQDLNLVPGVVGTLIEIKRLLQQIDATPIGQSAPLYEDIIQQVKTLGIPFEATFLFQTDAYKPTPTAELGTNVQYQLLEAVSFLNQISPAGVESSLTNFINKYIERYEDRELPLLKVLDTETGIGYNSSNSGDATPLLKGVALPPSPPVYPQWAPKTSILNTKLVEAIRNKQQEIELRVADFPHLKANWTDLPPTMSVMGEWIHTDNKQTFFYLKHAGGASASNLLGRFAHVSNSLHTYIHDIVATETQLQPEVIYAEIVHLPQSRLGNVILRPCTHAYEIPYLCQSAVAPEFQIPLSDILISIKSGKVVLRSKRFNKTIIPRLSNAHNYHNGSMPVYHFLCDLQTQGQRDGLMFSWGVLESMYDFLPRVRFKNIVISPAQWTVKKSEIKPFTDSQDVSNRLSLIKVWMGMRTLPQYVLLHEGDNNLFVDLCNTHSVAVWLSLVKDKEQFVLLEFLYTDTHALMKNAQGEGFCNELIFCIHRSKNESIE